MFLVANSEYFMIEEMKKKKYLMFGFLALAIIMWVSIVFFGSSRYADENVHIRQIHRFMKGNYYVMSGMTTIPGYHVVIATIASAFPPLSSQEIRLISLAVSLISVWVFYLLAKKLDAKDPYVKTLQYLFLPISFLYFPLIYTDIFSLLLVLIAFYFALSKKYSISAFFSLAAMTVRQNNIIWVIFFWIYTYISENGFSFSRKKLFTHLRSGIGYIIVTLLFFVFVWFNNGIAFGDQVKHQVGFYMGNIYFFLVALGVLFLPITITSLSRMNRVLLKKQVVWGVIIGFILAFCFFFFRSELHEYNLKLNFLRNIILFSAYHQYAIAYAFAIFFGCLTLSLMTFDKKSSILIPFIIACLLPSFLIEQRYAIIPLVFLLLFRKETSPKVEYINMIYFLFLSSGLVYMLLEIRMFF